MVACIQKGAGFPREDEPIVAPLPDSRCNAPPVPELPELETPLKYLPQNIDFEKLQVFRANYRSFRAGNAKGAKGEVGNVCPSAADMLALGFETFAECAKSISGTCESNVKFSVSFGGIDRAELEADPALQQSLLGKLEQVLEIEVGPPLESGHVKLALAAVAVVVHVTLSPPSAAAVEQVLHALADPSRLGREISRRVASVVGIEAAATGASITTEVSLPQATPRAAKLHRSMRRTGHALCEVPARARRRRDGMCCGCEYLCSTVAATDQQSLPYFLAWLLGGTHRGSRYVLGQLSAISWLFGVVAALVGGAADGIKAGLSNVCLPALLADWDPTADRYVDGLGGASWRASKKEVLYDADSMEHIGIMGAGTFGLVTLVRCAKTRRCFALKAMSKGAILKHNMYHCLQTEKQVMSESYSPFLIKLFASFSRENNIYLLMEPAMGGDLFNAYRTNNLFGLESHARFYTACVVRALEHLHQLRVMYRDLKMENIVLDLRGYGKLCDFGMAKAAVWPFRAYTLCGTLEYLAPEILTGYGYSYPVDWWALGVLVCEMVTGESPFEGSDPTEVHKKLMAGIDSVFLPEERAWADLVRGLCEKSPGDRLPLREAGLRNVERHPWYLEANFPWTAHAWQEMPAPYTPQLDGDADLQNFDSLAHRHPADVSYAGRDCNDWDNDFEAPWGPAPARVDDKRADSKETGHRSRTAEAPIPVDEHPYSNESTH